MFNMCSVISTHKDDDGDGRFPWRAIGITLALVGAIAYGAWSANWAVKELSAQKRADYLAVSGPVAEEVEQHLASGGDDQSFYADVISPLFKSEDDLAAIRIWNSAGALTCELTKADPRTVRAGQGGTLSEMNFHKTAKPLIAKLHNKSWTDPIMQMQLIANEQDTLAQRMGAFGKKNVNIHVREQFYTQQDYILQLTEDLNGKQQTLDQAIKDMNGILDLLTMDDDAILPEAVTKSDAVLDDISSVLAIYRTSFNTLSPLPHALAAAAPKDSSIWQRIWPTIYAERVIVPIFVPDESEQLVSPAGFVEILFYDHPSDILALLGWRRIGIVLGLLFLTLLMAVWPRRKEAIA